MTFDHEVKKQMDECVERFKNELRSIRTGRAHPGMLDNITVEVYGTQMNIKSLANVTVRDREILITPFDRSNLSSIAKGIETADMNLRAIVEGKEYVRVPVPELSEETRKGMVKLVRKKQEEAKVSIRGIRRDANTKVRELKEGGEIPEDAKNKLEKRVQELTDEYCRSIDRLSGEKEKEIMTL